MSRQDAGVVQALSRGLSILSLFDAEHREWSLDEMVAHTGLSRMTGYRIARTLRRAGYLVTDRVSGKFFLGPALLTTTYLAEGYAPLARTAHPYLQSLAEATGETATLAVDVGGVIVCADMVRSRRPNRQEIAVGRIISDTASAHGKVFAASRTGAEREEIARRSHVPRTPHTITDSGVLARELESIEREGIAFDMEERDLGTCAVAAPARNQTGRVVAALAAVVPAGRFGPAERVACADAVRAAAASLSAFLGYAGSRTGGGRAG